MLSSEVGKKAGREYLPWKMITTWSSVNVIKGRLLNVFHPLRPSHTRNGFKRLDEFLLLREEIF